METSRVNVRGPRSGLSDDRYFIRATRRHHSFERNDSHLPRHGVSKCCSLQTDPSNPSRSEPGRARLQSHRHLPGPFEVHRLNLEVLRRRIKIPETALDSICLIDRRSAGGVVNDLDGLLGG
jgi:hypothetical protein